MGLRPAGSYAPSALRPRFALPTRHPQGLRPSAFGLTPYIEAPASGGGIVPPVAAPPPRLRTPAEVGQGQKTVFQKKTGDGQRVEQPPRCATLSHPPRPFPLGRGASRPLSSRVQGGRPAALKPPTPMTRASIVPAASRAGLRPEILTRSVLASLRSACGFRFHP